MGSAPTRVVLTYRDFEALPADRGAKLQLYARHGITHYWIVDPDERRIEAYALTEGVFHAVACLSGADRGVLPPFSELTIAADTLWP